MSLTILFKGLYKRCACGCGKLIRVVDKKRRLRNFKKGHNANGELNYFWKGGIIYDSDGYVLIKCSNHPYCNNHGYVREHRLVMEKHIGRYLEPHEVVHHINEIKDDNRIENLQLIESNSKHRLLHSSLIDRSNYFCSICGSKSSRIENGYPHWYGSEGKRKCDVCYRKERYRKNYLKNLPSVKAYHKEYYRKNRERISLRDKLKRRALKQGVNEDLVEKTLREPLEQIKDI